MKFLRNFTSSFWQENSVDFSDGFSEFSDAQEVESTNGLRHDIAFYGFWSELSARIRWPGHSYEILPGFDRKERQSSVQPMVNPSGRIINCVMKLRSASEIKVINSLNHLLFTEISVVWVTEISVRSSAKADETSLKQKKQALSSIHL